MPETFNDIFRIPVLVVEDLPSLVRIGFVHGILGDTRGMAASLKRAGIADRYDLVLTFDYEI